MKRIFSKETGISTKRKAMCAIAVASLCSGLLLGTVGTAAAAENVAVESTALSVDDLSAEDRQIVETVTENFLLLANTPRPSGHMEKVSAALLEWAGEHGIAAVQDESLNIIFDIPATSGREDAPLCVLQAHMDMVCVSVPDKAYDPQNDPIQVIRDDEAGTLRADGTSLGADDGAGVAMIMAIAQGNMEHGPLRAIITVNEETDMKGAANIDKKYVADAAYLINVDSEKSDEVAVSSAANVDMSVTGQVTSSAPKGDAAVRVSLSGLAGGHSGMDIDKGRCNANRALAQVLRSLSEKGVSFELAEFTGGRAPNAIPAKAEAVLVLRHPPFCAL